MKKCDDILNKINYSNYVKKYSNEPTEDDLVKTAEIINKLFEEFTYIFPAFRQAWPTQSAFNGAKRMWRDMFYSYRLNDFDLIKKGLEKVAMSKKAFVPTVGEFIALCREKDDQALAPYHKEFPALEKQDSANPEAAKKGLSDMKKMLGIRK